MRWIRFPDHYATVGALWKSCGGRIASGPFKGILWMRRNPHLAYLLGTQELVLAAAIESLIGAGFRDLIHVRAADGSYAVGMALRYPGLHQHWFLMRPHEAPSRASRVDKDT